MRTNFLLIISLIFETSCSHLSPAPNRLPSSNDLNYVVPEMVGYSSQKLSSVKSVADEIHSPSGIVLVKGNVIYSWGDTSQKAWVHSCRKSILSALIGIAVSKGQMDLSKTLADLEVDDIPPSLTDDEKKATLFDLIKSRSGVYHL